MKVIDALKKELAVSPIKRLDLEVLLSFVLDKPREFLYANSSYDLTKKQEDLFGFLYKRRLDGEPLAYILGKKEFWSLDFLVNNKVLVPRPETEILVELVLGVGGENIRVADLGTGSGAIALAIAHERPDWDIVATDISEDALQIASYNAMQLGIQNTAFYCGNWCEALPEGKFDVIVSNPPYIKEGDLHLEQDGVRFEPKIALESGGGLVSIRTIITQAKSMLKSVSVLVLEHGYNQSEEVQELLLQEGYKEIKVHKDFAGINRAVSAKFFG